MGTSGFQRFPKWGPVMGGYIGGAMMHWGEVYVSRGGKVLGGPSPTWTEQWRDCALWNGCIWRGDGRYPPSSPAPQEKLHGGGAVWSMGKVAIPDPFMVICQEPVLLMLT